MKKGMKTMFFVILLLIATIVMFGCRDTYWLSHSESIETTTPNASNFISSEDVDETVIPEEVGETPAPEGPMESPYIPDDENVSRPDPG